MRKRKSGLPFSMPEKGTDRSILLCVKFEPVALDISMCETANFFFLQYLERKHPREHFQ